VPGQVHTPATPVANAPNEVTFATVTTSQLRVVFTHQAGKAVGVTELETWYPATPGLVGNFKLQNVNSGEVLGIYQASKANGVSALQWPDTGAPDHVWHFVDAGGGYYKIVNNNSGELLGVFNMSQSLGGQVLQWNDNGTDDHLWQIVDVGNGYYKIVNKNSRLLMGIQGASKTDGALAQQWNDSGTADHLWRLIPS
jgi:hypothetical protein